MISNLQIFMVGVPILIILGTDPQASFFVRSVIIWMNDLAVVTLIFGNLMYSVHMQGGNSDEEMKKAVGQAINRCSVVEARKSSGNKSSVEFRSNKSYQTRSVQFSETQENEDLKPSKHSRNQSNKRSSTASKASRGDSIHKGSKGPRKSGKEYDDYDDTNNSDNETFANEHEQLAMPVKKPVDVLAGTRSWANVNMSMYSVGNDDSGSDEEKPVASEDEMEEGRVGNSGGSGVISNKSQLPPASLPKSRPENMSYAHDRINNLRGKHAKKLASRQGKR